MKFFFDNTFSRKLVEFIGELSIEENLEVKHLRGMFDPGTKDQEWIRKLTLDGDWIVITADTRLARNPATRELLHQSNLTFFIFPKDFSRKNRWEQSWRMIKIWPDIFQNAKKKPSGAIFNITGSYKIKD